MVTFSRMRSIFFTEASLGGVIDAEDAISPGKSGQSSCRPRKGQKLQNQKDLCICAEVRVGRERPLSG